MTAESNIQSPCRKETSRGYGQILDLSRIGNVRCPVAKEEDGDKEHKGIGRNLWAPFFLRRPIMIVFLVSFLSILGTLIALYVYTERQHRSQGITTDGNKYYYLWTYGPTAGKEEPS